MRLTGKASSYFYSWLHQRFDYEPSYNAISSSEWFKSLHPSMQWGVIQDWADSIGYDMCIVKCVDGTYEMDVNGGIIQHHTTRQEARNAAIDKLNELVNGEK